MVIMETYTMETLMARRMVTMETYTMETYMAPRVVTIEACMERLMVTMERN